jgi:hypothetical protein
VLKVLVEAQALVPILSILVNSKDNAILEAVSSCINNLLAVAHGSK